MGWGEWEAIGYLKKRESSWRGKNDVRGVLQILLKPFLSFERGLKGFNEEKYPGNRKKRFCSMLYIASPKSRSLRRASHQPTFMGSCFTISNMCLPCLPSR